MQTKKQKTVSAKVSVFVYFQKLQSNLFDSDALETPIKLLDPEACEPLRTGDENDEQVMKMMNKLTYCRAVKITQMLSLTGSDEVQK